MRDEPFRLLPHREAPLARNSVSAAEAGRRLYNISRDSHATANDSDRIAKFLKTYKLKFSMLQHT